MLEKNLAHKNLADMYSSYQTSYLDVPDSISLEEMMECDIREMDMNFNDPLFTEQNLFSPDAQRVMKQERRVDCISPGDLTNLQWLQNVSIPMEKNANGQDKSVMVDPNTVMPVQWQNHQQQQLPVTSIPNMNISQPVTQQTQLNVQPRLDQKHRTQDQKLNKENSKSNEKAYPKPLFSYSCLIAMALQNSDAGTLPVSEIYKFMMGKFPYFKTAPDGWKNSVRHNLSLNKAFCKLERPQGASQRKGCLWSLRPERKEQMEKEIKKWKKKHAEAIRASMAHPEELQLSSEDLEESLQTRQPHHIEDVAAADAAKELFGNNLIQEIQQHEELDWDDIISSGTDLNLAPALSSSSMAPNINDLNIQSAPVTTTTVELDNSAQYFINGHEFDNTNYNVSNYYNLQPQQMTHLSTGGF